MTHSEVRALLNDYLEGDLEIAERVRIEDHLPECSTCSEELYALRETIALLRGLPDVEAPAGFAATVMGRIDAGEATAPILLRAFRALAEPRFAAPLAAGLAGMALFVGLQAITPDRATRSVGPLPAPSPMHLNVAAFKGRSDRLTPDFIENRLNAIEQYAGVRRQQEIRAFADQLRRSEDDERARRLLMSSRHRLAASVVFQMRPTALQSGPSVVPGPTPVPVMVTSGPR